MKKFKHAIIFFTVLLLSACSDFLDRVPKDILTDDQVWKDPNAIEAYLARMYNDMQTEDLGYTVLDEAGFLSTITDEAVRSYVWGSINDPIIPNGAGDWWGYSQIRTANEFLERIDGGAVNNDLKQKYKSEARFIRAFHYFAMVKRYGGVPLITKPQDISEGIGSLQVPRNTEKEIYDFLLKELDDVILTLPATYSSENKFRATKYSALALKSRAMLYAGSIASFGNLDLKGLVGIPATDKNFYWKESKKASEEIINSKLFSLYNKDNDKSTNFQKLFLDKSLHSEALFVKAFKAPDKCHSYDFYNAPQSFKVDYGCVTNPSVEIVEEFEYIDGSPGKLKITDNLGLPIQYKDPRDLFKDKDPRLLATIMTPFSSWQGGIIEIRKGIIDGDKIITAPNLTDAYGDGNSKITITGKDGPLDVQDPTKTGFYLKKYMDPTNRVNYNRSETNWMIFRYAEILLNYSEACVELGEDLDNALIQLNLIRSRAGIKELDKIDRQIVRKERKMELAFENHRFWDLRRWRIATDELNNKVFKSLNPYLVWEKGKKPEEMKYIFKIEGNKKNTRTFLPRHYYVRIPSQQITTNPKLEQNPLY